jgi:hypothetical protein
MRGTRGTHASMQSCRQGALTCMGWVGACGASSLGVCGVAHNQRTNQRKKSQHTHTHTVASWSNDSWRTQLGRGLEREDTSEHCAHAWERMLGYIPTAGGDVHRHNTGINVNAVFAQGMKAGCSAVDHLGTQDVSYMIRNALQARKTRTGRLGSTTEVTTVVTNDEHVCTQMQWARTRYNRAVKMHDTRSVHIPSRQAGEGEDGQRRAQRDITCCAKRKEFRARGPHRCNERGQDTPSRQGA